jgi:hypothetical protein
MGLIDKLKLLVKTAKPAGQFVNAVKGAKMKWKTIPFWSALLGSAVSLVAALQGFIPMTYFVIATGILTSAYQIIRGLDKADQEGVKPTWKSSEFLLGALAVLSVNITAMQTQGINSPILVTFNTVLTSLMAIMQNVGAQQPEDVKKLVEESK